MPDHPSFAFVASDVPQARNALERLNQRYAPVPVAEADVVVALGGDGFMLETLHTHMRNGVAIFGMNCGTVGFLMNEYREDGLMARIKQAQLQSLHPLRMTATCGGGNQHKAVATPAGSTAYNLSAHGPILPLGAPLLSLTPISAFRPRRWRGALIPHGAEVTFEILEQGKRPVSATADYTEIRDVKTVAVREDRGVELRLLFDPEHNLEERILKEQFVP